MNVFIQINKRKIEFIKRQLIEYDYAGSYGGNINLMDVNNIIDGLLIEVTKLEKENINLKETIKKMEERTKEIKQ